MSEPPRDPLAEHPLGAEAPRKKRPATSTLDLFPDVGEAPLVAPAEDDPSPSAAGLAARPRRVPLPLGPRAAGAGAVRVGHDTGHGARGPPHPRGGRRLPHA